MSRDLEKLQQLLAEMAVLIEQNDELDPQMYALLLQHPEYAIDLINIVNNLEEETVEDNPPIYSACVLGLDMCIAQLQAAKEVNSKVSTKSLTALMNYLAEIINSKKHHLSFWLPVLNIFYEVHVDLTPQLQNAYYELANQEEDESPELDDVSHLDSIRELIQELSHLSIFAVAEHFFAQSYAMPPDFFIDLMVDLYNIKEGEDIALLILLHPKAAVREVAVSTLNELMEHITLSSLSLSRLQAVKYWYPPHFHGLFEQWIKLQRRKGVVFAPENTVASLKIKATEVDGSGSQGLFIHGRRGRKNKICGLLFKYHLGIKDAWSTPFISAKEVTSYYRKAFEESVTLREVHSDYLCLMAEHFLALAIEKDDVPYLHFLEIQEWLGLRLRPNKIDVRSLIAELSVEITPFTPEVIQEALKRSKTWLKTKPFTESWYLESALVDKIVNHNSSFVEGVKICHMENAMRAVFKEVFETDRDRWQFHFLWIALWAKAKAKLNEKLWQDSFLIAYSIHKGMPLKDIPVMHEVGYQTIVNSIETMQDRKTHLN